MGASIVGVDRRAKYVTIHFDNDLRVMFHLSQAGLLPECRIVGSSLEVYPVAGLPQETLEAGGRLAILNRGPTPYDARADLKLDASAGEILGRVLDLTASARI